MLFRSILYTDREKIEDEDHLRPFLYTIARNLALKYLRDKGRSKEFAVEPGVIADASALESDLRETELLKGEILVALRISKSGLSARKRHIIELFYWDNKSTREIAELLGIDRQTVRNHLSQSIILLRKSLDGHWEEINLFFS